MRAGRTDIASRLRCRSPPFMSTARCGRRSSSISSRTRSNSPSTGGIEVLLRDAGESAELTVRDTGVGIPAERIAARFRALPPRRRPAGRTHEGSGIGLALVRELVHTARWHGLGRSEVGRGTTFTVALPYRKGATKADETTSRELADLARATAFVEEALRWLPQDGQPGKYATTLLQAAKQNALFDTAGCDAAAGSRPTRPRRRR